MKDAYLQYGVVAKECEAVISHVKKSEWQQATIKVSVVLAGLRRRYEQVREIASPSAKDPSVKARSAEVVMPVVRDSVNFLEKILRLAPKENMAFQDAIYRIEKMKSFFEVEALKFELEPNASVEQEIESVGSLNADDKQTISGDFLTSCCQNLYQAATTDFSHFTCDELREVSKAHASVYVDLQIMQSLLKPVSPNSLVERVSLAIDLLWRELPHYGHPAYDKQYPADMRETLSDITRSKNTMVKSLDHFLKNAKDGDAANLVKCDLIRACIENKLRTTSSNKPWQLGWAGSRHRITFEGKIYDVPKGIHDLYTSVKPTEGLVDWERVTKVTEQVQTKQSSVGLFLSGLFGCRRRKETQRFYEELQDCVKEQSVPKVFHALRGGRSH